MGFDEPTIAAGLLHDTVEDTKATIEELDENFGEEVADIVDGVTKISQITFENKEEAQAENIRKMILAMAVHCHRQSFVSIKMKLLFKFKLYHTDFIIKNCTKNCILC